MSAITIDQYRLQTGDSTTASALVQTRLDEAEALVEDYLRRELASEQRTEKVRWSRTCRVYPKHTPITEVPATAAYSVEDEATIIDVGYSAVDQAVGEWPAPIPDDYRHNAPYALITYTGGWTADTMPKTLVRIVSQLAYRLGNQSAIGGPGVSSASVGDVSVSYSQKAIDGATHPVDALLPLSSVMLKPYRWRPL